MESIIINSQTGELLEKGVFKTHEQIQQDKDYFKRLEEKELKHQQINETYKEFGNFTWFLYNVNTMLEIGIKPDELTKLIFISTYMDYSNKLMSTQRMNMTKKNMNELLKVSERKFYDFYNTMINSKIFVEQENGVYLNDNLFAKGSIKETDINVNKIRLYANGIRSVYNNAKPTEHKLLSYLFQAIPFINIDYNTICHNPLVGDIAKVKAMTLSDFCEILGYDETNCTRLKNKLIKITLDSKPVFNMVLNNDGIFMFINPKVYYAGDKWDSVKVLGGFNK